MLTKLKRFIKDHSRKSYLVLGRVFAAYRNGIITLARLRGTDRGTVVFSSFDYRNYNDNPRYISEALHAMAPDINIVWLFKDGAQARDRLQIPDYVRIRKSIGCSGVSIMARARVVVDNFNKRFYLRFPGRNQIYIQTWHGDRAFKKVGYDNPDSYNVGREEFASLCVAGSDYGERQFRTAFRYKGEVMKIGTPRNDILVRNDPAEAAAIRSKFGLKDDESYLLYAPTFRDVNLHAHEKQRSSLDLLKVLDALETSTGQKWKCLIRAHYLSEGIENAKDSDRFIDATGFQEMSEIMLVSDALLTDYSSCAGDFALLRRPIFLYQDDLQDYISNNRALYFNMSDLPYWACQDPEGLIRLIRENTPEKAAANCDAILEFYGTHENGRAAETIARYIIDKLKN